MRGSWEELLVNKRVRRLCLRWLSLPSCAVSCHTLTSCARCCAAQLGFLDAWVHLQAAGNIAKALQRAQDGPAQLEQALRVGRRSSEGRVGWPGALDPCSCRDTCTPCVLRMRPCKVATSAQAELCLCRLCSPLLLAGARRVAGGTAGTGVQARDWLVHRHAHPHVHKPQGMRSSSSGRAVAAALGHKQRPARLCSALLRAAPVPLSPLNPLNAPRLSPLPRLLSQLGPAGVVGAAAHRCRQ